MSLDLDRGCIKRVHPSGMGINMYSDTPGIYYDDSGVLMSEELAAGAGFDISQLAKDRERGIRTADYMKRVADEFEAAEDRLARLASDGVEHAEIKAVSKDKFAIFRDDERLVPFDMSLAEAEDLLQSLAPEDIDDAGTQTDNETQTAETDAKAMNAGRT